MGKINLSIIHNRLKRGTAQKPVSVELRFTCGGKRKYISTGVKVCPSQWSEGSKHVIRCKDAEVFNKQIDAFIERANEVIAKMIAKGSTDLEEIPSLMEGCSDKYADFIAYCEERTKQRKVSDHTKRRYKVFTDFLKKWGKIKEFSDVNVSNVRALDEYLHAKGLEQSTVYCYHKYLKLFVRDACIDELVDKNPYNYLPFKIAKGDKEFVDCLPIEKFESIKRLHLEVDYLAKARDLFLMQCYTGLAYSDLMAFDFSECEKSGDKYYYHGKRVKTDTDFTFQLLGGAVTILKSTTSTCRKSAIRSITSTLKPSVQSWVCLNCIATWVGLRLLRSSSRSGCLSTWWRGCSGIPTSSRHKGTLARSIVMFTRHLIT